MTSRATPPTVRLEWSRGQTTLLVDGEPVAPLGYCSARLDARQLKLFVERGVRILSFPTTCDHHLYGLASTAWSGPGCHDWSELDHRLASILEVVPDAWLLPRVYTCSPPWWDRRNPLELVHWGDGTTRLALHHGANKDQVPSLASERWAEARRDNLRRYVEHVEAGPFGARVLGYHVTSGNSEEWFHWGAMEGASFDHGDVARTRFRAWLRERHGDDAELSRAWGRKLSFEEADIPAASRRAERGPFGPRRLPEDQDLVDHARFLAELTADAILDCAAVVKECAPTKLFGTFYGYLAELAYHPDGLAFGGHLGLSRLLSSDSPVDFLASPASYARRSVAEGFSFPMLPAASLGRARMPSFHENDVRTHRLADSAGYGRTRDAFETVSIQRRELASAWTKGQGLWWFDMTAGWYDDPAVTEEIARLAAIATRLGELPRRSVSEVAYVLDEESLLRLRGHPNQMIEALVRPLHELARLGAPFEVLRLADLRESSPYRLVILPTAIPAGSDGLRLLEERVAAWGATLLWLGPRPVEEGGVIQDASGFLLEPGERELQLARSVEGEVFGSPRLHLRNARFVSPEGAVRAHFVRSGDPALVVEERQRHRVASSLVSAVPARVLRRLLREAKGRVISESGDALDVCNRLVSLHATKAGVKRLSLPDDARLYDLVNEVELEPKDGGFEFYLARGDTALFFRGSRAQWLG